LNSHETFPERAIALDWEWQPPHYKLAFSSYGSQAWGFVVQHRTAFVSVALALAFGLFVFRYEFQPTAVALRIYADAIVVTGAVYALTWYVLARYFTKWKRMRFVGTIAGVAVALALMWAGTSVHRYIGQYWRYKTLNLVELDRMPITEHERVLSLNGIYTLAKSLRDQTERVSKPTFIKTPTGYCWSMAVEPDRLWQQWHDDIDEVLCVPGGDSSPDLARRGLIPVHLTFGENLLWSRNIDTCSRRALGLFRFFSYEPERPFVAERDGKRVWIVPWIRWVGTLGVFFPRPEFGGVQIIPETPEYSALRRWLWEAPKRVLTGCGEWIPAQDVHNHEFLRGQNLMPDSVSRSYAESFRFQESILGPLGFFKAGDVRIADSEGDMNKQPYTSYYKMPLSDNRGDKLYDSFALEPNDVGKKTLVTSLFVPGDGIGPSYVYRHSLRNEAPMGITYVDSQVRQSRPDFFWSDRRVEEHRYYIRDLPDTKGRVKRRIMYLSVVVLVEKKTDDKGATEVTTGSTPFIAITDSDSREVEWVDAHHPEQWDEKLKAKFGPRWSERAK
jgi:hypothetical protein